MTGHWTTARMISPLTTSWKDRLLRGGIKYVYMFFELQERYVNTSVDQVFYEPSRIIDVNLFLV